MTYATLVAGHSAEPRDVADLLGLNESGTIYTHDGQTVWADWEMALANIPSQTIDCILTDPPYWTLDRWREIGTTARLGGALKEGARDARKWFPTIDSEGLWRLVCECYRVLKPNAHAWIMCDGETLGHLLNYGREGSGDGHAFKYVKPYPVLKMARTGGYKQGMGYHGRACHEFVVLLEKGRRRFSEENWPDVFKATWDGASASRKHTPDGEPYPTAKPVELFARWAALSSSPGETILDPFLGSGTTALAALSLGCKWLGVDSSPLAIETTHNRLRARTASLFDAGGAPQADEEESK